MAKKKVTFKGYCDGASKIIYALAALLYALSQLIHAIIS